MKRVLVLLVAALTAASLLPGAPAVGQTPGQVEVRIVRDNYGVPHVYSATAEGVAWGAGYAITVDRLFQMDILRANAKGRMQELFGPVPGFDAMDRSQRRLGYTDAERRAKFTRLPLYLQRLYIAYVDGVNARINEVRSNPAILPQEYTQFGLGQPRPWDLTDSVAIADLLVQTFGAGGGSELQQAALLKYLQEKYGNDAEALGAFDDIRWLNDPAAPASIPADFDWREEPTAAKDLPAKEWRRDARIGLTDAQRKPLGPAEGERGEPQVGTIPQEELVPDAPSAASVEQLESHLRGEQERAKLVSFGSNAFITGPDRTAGGGTLQLGGPQVGHFVPEAIAEFGLHTDDGSWDMTGLTFAGSGPAVLIGRTPYFAWTTTTGNSDGTDIYVEQLGPEPETYVYEGQVERMDCRDEQIRNKNGTPRETIRVCRTRHGVVLATDTENGIAYSQRRAWFDHETGSIEGFFGANFVRSIEEFATSINKLQSNHNMFYVDADGNYGYWHPGAIPLRPEGTDVRLPQDGRFAATEWVRMRTAQEMPHAVNFPRGWLANWNNKPAVDWNNGDGANYGAVFRNVIWDQLLAADGEMTLEDGEAFNRINSTIETEFHFFQSHIVRAGRASSDERVRAAAEVLAEWNARRRDEDGDDLVDDEPGYSLWKGWRGLARSQAFDDDLESFSNRASDSMLLHVLEGEDASLPPSRDWLNGKAVDEFLNEVMVANLDALEAEYGTADMSEWRAPMRKQFYTRLNVRFYECNVGRAAQMEAGCDDRLPGNVRELDYMNRGTYNHLVEFTPGEQAEALPEADGALVEPRDSYTVRAESIISPGQSGFINQAGQQDAHYEDQHDLYEQFRYKPMPLREDDVVELGDGTVLTKTYTFALDPVTRVAGTNRIATALAASQRNFETATEVVIASAADFPDALAAAPLAVKLEGPLLLAGDRLDEGTKEELGRLGAARATIVGGAAAVSAAYEGELKAAGVEVRRLAGPTRFDTAAAVATEVAGEATPNGEVFLASGRVFADALAAGPVAGSLGVPILLTEPQSLPEATKAALESIGATTTFVLGGPAAVADAVAAEAPGAQRLAGNNRYATAVAVAEFGLGRGMNATAVHVATGGAFPDGLAAGAVAGRADQPLLLVEGGDAAAGDIAYETIGRRASTVGGVFVYGGVAAVGDPAAERAQLAASQR